MPPPRSFECNARSVRVVELDPGDVGLIRSIDRSEHVEVEYAVVDGRLTERPVTIIDVPMWDADGAGPFSVGAQIEFCAPIVADGALLFGAFDEADEVMGLAIVDPDFEPGLAWFAWLHVSRPHRRRGVAGALWDPCVRAALDAGASTMYVSATPTGSAVGFYLSRGCRLAEPVHPVLFEHEPDDVHLVCPIR